MPRPTADLSLSLCVSPCPARPGRPVLYLFSLFNAGPEEAGAVRLCCAPPPGLEELRWTQDPAGPGRPWTGTAELGALPPRRGMQLILAGRVPPGARLPLICAAALSSAADDPVLANNTVTLATPLDLTG